MRQNLNEYYRKKVSTNQNIISIDYLVKPEIVNRNVTHDKAANRKKFGNFTDELPANINYKR